MKKRGPTPPSHLSAETKAWWRVVNEEFELEEHHRKLLQTAAEAWDRCQQARRILDESGIVFTDDRGNVRAHPAVAIEKDARTAFARLVRELDLDTEPTKTDRRPPAIRSNRG